MALVWGYLLCVLVCLAQNFCMLNWWWWCKFKYWITIKIFRCVLWQFTWSIIIIECFAADNIISLSNNYIFLSAANGIRECSFCFTRNLKIILLIIFHENSHRKIPVKSACNRHAICLSLYRKEFPWKVSDWVSMNLLPWARRFPAILSGFAMFDFDECWTNIGSLA